jgi:hypothetical protein
MKSTDKHEKSTDKHEKHLQTLLVKAQEALDEVKHYAVLHNLEFEFAGLRRGLEGRDYGPVTREDFGGEDDEYLQREIKAGRYSVKVSSLDFDSKWMGSWSPGCG